MDDFIPVAIPRWQWRTVAHDLTPLFERFPAWQRDAGNRIEEVHLVCPHSSHSALLRGDRLQLRWRKESCAEGFELWDTIVDVAAPFPLDAVARLWTVLGLPGAPPHTYYATAALLLDVAAADRSVTPVRIVRTAQEIGFQGIGCTLETIRVGPADTVDSFSVEHEDPSLLIQVLGDLGLDTTPNTNLLQTIKSVLGLNDHAFRKPKWPKKSSASISST